MVLSSEKLHGDVMPTDLRARISSGLKEAMKNKDVARLATLRLVSAAIKDREIAQRGGSDEQEVTDSDVIGILGKMVKQRQESARAYEEGGRLDLAERELAEIGVIEEFLPRKLNEDEIKKAVDRAIRETEASSIRDMGRVMGVLKSEYTGRMDFGRVGPMIKDMLG
jgi:hypothetical protein